MLRPMPLAAGAFALVLAGAGSGQEARTGVTEVPLRYEADRDFALELPNEVWTPVGRQLRLGLYGDRRFAAQLEGTTLCVDTDGDGTTDVRAEGAQAFLTMRGPVAGKETAYAVRLANTKGWHYAAAGYVTGELAGERIRVIDQNNNGVYGEVGKDAMLIGRGKLATFLSGVVAIGDQLLEVEVAADGTSLTARPWTGPTGSVALRYETQGKVLSAVIGSNDGRLFFDLARSANGANPVRVPAGDYRILAGKIGLGADRVTVRGGRSKAFAVASDAKVDLAWGGPVTAEFAYERAQGQVQLSPDKVWYYGAAGEEYASWTPLGQSPTFTIIDSEGKEVARAYFPGSC